MMWRSLWPLLQRVVNDAFLMFPLFPGNDPIRSEPRFQAALERMGLEWARGL